MNRTTISALIALLALTCPRLAFAQHVPNKALTSFLDRHEFPKGPIPRSQVDQIPGWKSTSSEYAWYTTDAFENSDPIIRSPIRACSNRSLRGAFITAYFGYANDPLGNQNLRGLTRQITPSADGEVDANAEYEKVLSRFGRNAKIEYDRRNLVLRGLKFIESVSYQISHHGQPVFVNFEINDYGCLQVRTSYVGVEVDRAKQEAEKKSIRGKDISDALK